MGGKAATKTSGGIGSGNKGTNGEYAEYNTKNFSNGYLKYTYGYGSNALSSASVGKSGHGAVYLKYIGE